MEDSNDRRIPWALFVSELIGTALLVLVDLSLVILMFGTGTPMACLIPGEGLRRLITGFLFGTTGACIALSPVGKVSGAHINPAVTLGFRLMGKLDLRTTLETGSKQALFVWKRTKVQEMSREVIGKSVEYRVSREYRNIDEAKALLFHTKPYTPYLKHVRFKETR